MASSQMHFVKLERPRGETACVIQCSSFCLSVRDSRRSEVVEMCGSLGRQRCHDLWLIWWIRGRLANEECGMPAVFGSIHV